MHKIRFPEDPKLVELCQQIRELGCRFPDRWPADQLKLCAENGVFEWFLPRDVGGQEWKNDEIVSGYFSLSSSCLTTTFVITQFMGACRRIASSPETAVVRQILPDLVSGEKFATVGISHLTTSHRHLKRPVLTATEKNGGFLLNGFSPWVTGADHADFVLVGATLDDGRQLLTVVPTDLPGITVPPPPKLVGLNGSHTGRFEAEQVFVTTDWLVAGPVHDVMQSGTGAATGGLQTSTLAAGLAHAAVQYLRKESELRSELASPTSRFEAEVAQLRSELLDAARGVGHCTAQDLRAKSNSLVLRATQAALAAAKGAGYVEGHEAGRWCREALFFLVWSCPQPVMNANLCELAGIAD